MDKALLSVSGPYGWGYGPKKADKRIATHRVRKEGGVDMRSVCYGCGFCGTGWVGDLCRGCYDAFMDSFDDE